jgi:hypothetical protein
LDARDILSGPGICSLGKQTMPKGAAMAIYDDFESRRAEVRERVRSSGGTEGALVELLSDIDIWMSDDLRLYVDDGLDRTEAFAVLAAAEAWASLVSFATQEFYGGDFPEVGTPFRRFAGWERDVPRRLRELADRFVDPLRAVVRALGIDGFSIGVSFPLGVSLSLNWG